jgi:alpha-tubulin suppressor-like RCC1 family protein
LTASGNAYCWGSNAGGALGDGSLADSRVPVAVDTPTTLQSIAAGDGFTCGLTSGDTIDCWGSGADGQLGDGNSGAGTTATTPVEVQLDYNNWTPLEVSAGRAHVCVRAEATGTPSDKRVFCWGANGSGQLGDGSTSRSATPVEVDHDFSQDAARSVSAGGDNGCMVVEDASNALVTYCWGDNGFGQIGDGSKSDRDSPTQVGGSHAFATVHAGIGHACGVLSGGDARCWGDNAAGQLGNGASGGQETAPVDVSGSFSFDTLSLGDAVSCGIVGNGTLYCWGSDADGRLGTGGGGDASSPTGVATP